MKKTSSLIGWLFAIYGILMLWLLFGQRISIIGSDMWTENYWETFRQKINLIPLHTIGEFWDNLRGGGRSHAFINLAGNVIMFVPLGFFIPGVFHYAKNFLRSMLFAFITIACIEIFQLFTLLGSLDVDDLLLNLVGVALGYSIYRIMSHKRKESMDS